MAPNAGREPDTLRYLWVYVNIICGHIPDGAETFDPAVVTDETQGEWYLRQMLGTANFEVSPLVALSCGHLCYQIEHQLFPDLPSNRLRQISVRVRELCEKYDLPYDSASLPRQLFRTQKISHGLAVPDRMLKAGGRFRK